MPTFAASRYQRLRAGRLGFLLLAGLFGTGQAVEAQEAVAAPSQQSLDQCIQLGLERQPALAAARASLAAAYSGQQGVNNLPRFAGLLARDLPIRREQSCLGVTIASAGLQQAEWETRYAVRRTYYSVQFARTQREVINGAVEKVEKAHKRAIELVKVGDPEFKVTQIDVDVLEITIKLLKTKQAEADVGVKKALAGLREAIGVGLDYPLSVGAEPLPTLVKEINRDEMISLARANRPEIEQVQAVNRVTELEIEAQRRLCFKMQANTFAIASDIHAKPVPQGYANSEYRPGAIGPEMPPTLVGPRADRVQRAEDFNSRSVAVVDKTDNLITLEVEATLLKWLEASLNVYNLQPTPKMARKVAENVQKRFSDGKATGEEYLRARTLEDQAQAQYNDALFQHALALAALERVTAGGYRIAAGK